jgi:signal peptidase I
MVPLAIFAGVIGVNFLLTVFFVWLGARLSNAAKATVPRAMAAVIAMAFATVPIRALAFVVPDQLAAQAVGLLILLTLLVSVEIWILRRILHTTRRKAFLIWLVCLIPALDVLALTSFVVRPYATEAFVIPTNSMAPALLGRHKSGTCPRCGGELIVSAPTGFDNRVVPGDTDIGMCLKCLKTSEVPAFEGVIENGDRILVDKLRKAQRWDIIVFVYPVEPDMNYVFRLVGLPGETIEIRDNAVWINGTLATMPGELAELEYEVPAFEGETPEGNPVTNPFKLGPDEYFVLGDFSKRAKDSRFWGPVPESHLIGVVSVRYWPVARWKVW